MKHPEHKNTKRLLQALTCSRAAVLLVFWMGAEASAQSFSQNPDVFVSEGTSVYEAAVQSPPSTASLAAPRKRKGVQKKRGNKAVAGAPAPVHKDAMLCSGTQPAPFFSWLCPEGAAVLTAPGKEVKMLAQAAGYEAPYSTAPASSIKRQTLRHRHRAKLCSNSTRHTCRPPPPLS